MTSNAWEELKKRARQNENTCTPPWGAKKMKQGIP